MQMGVAHECAGQEARFGDDLEAIADAQNLQSFRGLGANVGHDGRARGDGAAAEIIAIGKATGDNDEINFGQLRIGVPDGNRGNAGYGLEGQHHVAFTIDTGENDDG